MMKPLQQKTHFPVTFDSLGRLQLETSLKVNNNSVGLPLSTIMQDGNTKTEVQTEGFNLKSLSFKVSNIAASINYK